MGRKESNQTKLTSYVLTLKARITKSRMFLFARIALCIDLTQ